MQIVYQSEDDPEKERLLEENKEMRGEMDALQDKVLQLELVLKEKEKRIDSLGTNCAKVLSSEAPITLKMAVNLSIFSADANHEH